jgi:hypothetical protein
MRNSSIGRLFAIAALTAACGVVASGTALADAVQAGVTIPAGQPVPVITENGSGYTPGSYGVGTIHLNYTVVGTTFPTGPFATFELKMSDFASSGKTPSYPALLAVSQNGNSPLILTPATSPLSVSGPGWAGSTLVTISISDEVAADPALNEDGDVLAGKLQLVAQDNQHLKTPTDILVHITLVHPTACLKVYDFMSDASLANTVTSTEVNVNQKGKVTATNPYGSLSHNVMVVNTCGSTETFDLRIYLDSWFSTQGNGNAVFTFTTAGEADPSTFNMALFGTGSGKGQNLCLENITVSADTTFLATVHTNINNGLLATGLPANGVFSGFSSTLTTTGLSCGGDLLSFATPNPAATTLSFTIK